MSPTMAKAVPSKAHDTKATAQAMSLQAQREPNALPSRAQASHARVPHAEQPTHVAQLAPSEQLTLVVQPASAEQPTLVAQPAPTEQLTLVAFQAAQIGPRLVQPSRLQIFGLTIELVAFSPHFSADLTFPNSNLAPRVYHPSTAQRGTFLPISSNPNGEQLLSRQVIKLTSALAQQTTLVNQLLQRTKMQRAPNKVSRSRTKADEEPLNYSTSHESSVQAVYTPDWTP